MTELVSGPKRLFGKASAGSFEMVVTGSGGANMIAPSLTASLGDTPNVVRFKTLASERGTHHVSPPPVGSLAGRLATALVSAALVRALRKAVTKLA